MSSSILKRVFYDVCSIAAGTLFAFAFLLVLRWYFLLDETGATTTELAAIPRIVALCGLLMTCMYFLRRGES